MKVPYYLKQWFKQKGWVMHAYQETMFELFFKKNSSLLIAPTGGGKTLASFLPSLIDIHENQYKGLHTLYISPLKALTEDIRRNLLNPIDELNLKVDVHIRTGDTSSYQRQRQLKKPPNILLTTPESLMLLLSYPTAASYFANLKVVIVDEIHSFAWNKRGDLTSLALMQLRAFALKSLRIGLSATVAEPKQIASWLMPKGEKAEIIIAKTKVQPQLHLIAADKIPYSGYMAGYAIDAIYDILKAHKLTLIFVNTRAQAEFLFHRLWLVNHNKLAIAIYHGSLSKEQRLKTTALVSDAKIDALVCTSALELGIDWGNVSAVIQVGSIYGLSRLVQRIGRSNHRLNEPSEAYLVPTNCFNTVEAIAAMNAIKKAKLEKEKLGEGSLDVLIQFIINSACRGPVKEGAIFRLIRKAYPYQKLSKVIFAQLFQFAINGGYTLAHYPEYQRLRETKKRVYIAASPKVIRRHRQNIGTIVESARLKVKILNKRKDKIVGEIEESFIQELLPQDSFLFAGEILEFVRLHDLYVETRRIKAKDPKLPSYAGGTLPLSTFLATEVIKLINHPSQWAKMPKKIQHWLDLQQRFSLIPPLNALLIEQFKHKKMNYLVIYSFAGKRANLSLGMLISKQLESLKLKPISFTATDYALAIANLDSIKDEQIISLFSLESLFHELEQWLDDSSLLKRTFREVAIISGLAERQIAGTHKSMKQVTFSTDLIYDVLKRYEPEHILLYITKKEALANLLDIKRLNQWLVSFKNKMIINHLSHASPFAIPVLTTFKSERIKGEAEEVLLANMELEGKALKWMEEVQQIVKKQE